MDLSIVDVATAAAARSGLQHGSPDVDLSGAHAALAEALLATVRASQFLCGTD